MKKSRFTEEQIIGFLRQAEAGMPVKELCTQGGFSDATFYKWRAKFGGMQATDAKRLRELESENAKLKRLLAEAHLDIHALKDVFGVKPYLRIPIKPTTCSSSNPPAIPIRCRHPGRSGWQSPRSQSLPG